MEYQTKPVSPDNIDGPTFVWVAGNGWWEVLKVFWTRKDAQAFVNKGK